jgi:hypothetical protein
MRISQTPSWLVVDEMDLPVLNLGSGDKALHLNENFRGPRGPVINVDINPQPHLQDMGRPVVGAIHTEPPNPVPLHTQADASNTKKLAQFSPTGRFREIHAINPYGFYPHDTFPLLAPGGSMYISGQEKNFYAKDVPHVETQKGRWNKNPEKRLPQITEPTRSRYDNAIYDSTKPGELRPEHAKLTQQTTHGTKEIDTSKSTTVTITKLNR